MMQDVSGETTKDKKELRTVEINEGSISPFQAGEKSQVKGSRGNFGADMSGSDDDEASEVDSFILDENDMEGTEEVLESSKFLLAAETEGGQQQLQTVDPETHARLEALLEAAGISKLSSKDGKALTDPEVLRTLTSSVSSALDEATQAINCMRTEQQGQVQGAEGTQALSDRDSGAVRKLYESGSVPDTTEEGESLLSLACSAGYYELAQVLLAMNANVEDRGIKGDCTPLMEAASGGFVDIVRLLILHGADVNAQSSAGNTPLHSAACAGHTNVVKELISHGAHVEVHNENGHTPLMEAASAGHVDIAQQLLEAGAGINTHSNEFKESALTLACYKGHLEMVKFLLDAGADQEHKTDEMHTALMEASMDGHVEVARLLLDSGAQVNMPADSFESPLTLAACGGHTDLANLLIERGANIEEVNDEGYTPLMEAAREGHEEMVALLLSHGADINAQTEETQETALTLACCGGFQEVVEFLIKSGADIELGCSTPLMEAAQEGHHDLVKFLLEASANVHAQTGTNDTALTYACENGHTDVAKELLHHGAFLEHESEGGRTPLMKAARAGHSCTVSYLISKGADVNRSTSTNDHSVLSLACAGGHQQVVETLLNNGADPNHKLKDGSTMIIEAAKGGHTSVVKLLLEWPNRLLQNASGDLAQPDLPHINLAQSLVEEPRVPVQGLAHIVPPNEPDSQHPNCQNFIPNPGERQNAGKILAKRILSTTSDGKLTGKASNSVIVENPQQVGQEGATLADLTDEKATEKVEAIINNIMAKELLGPSVGSKEEQLQRKQQILEELQKVERELQEKAQAQQQLEQQQQALKSRSTASTASTASTPVAVRQAEETAKKMMEMKSAAAGATAVAAASSPLRDFMQQLPSLLPKADLPAAAQSLITNPAYSPSQSFLQSLAAPPSPGVSPGVSVAQQVQPPSPQFLQQPISSPVVSSGNCAGKVAKGRNNSGKVTRSAKLPQQQPPLPPAPPQQRAGANPQQVAHSLSPQLAPLTLNLHPQAEHTADWQSHLDSACVAPLQLSGEALQQQQLALLTQSQQQQLPFPPLTPQQQEQLLQQMLNQPALQSNLGQAYQAPLHPLLPQVPSQQAQQAPQLLTQQERAQLLHQTHQAQLLQQQLLKQTTTAAAAAATLPNSNGLTPSAVPDLQQGSLYQSSLDVDSQTESNHDTALTLACAGGHSELVSLLLAKGADIEHRDKKGFTPLILGATAGHLEVVEILLDHGADIEAQSERTKDTPLSLACSGGRFEVVELLLARGANKEHRNVSDYTPLSLAASGGYVNIIKLLLSHGAEINSRTGSKLGISPLMLAAMNGHTQAVKLLLDMGSDINAQIETNRNTALTLACFQGRHEVVSLLVDRKANIEHRAKTGLTPLMEAASGGYVEVGRVLLDKGADVNAPPVPSSRDTALTIAADKGHYRFVELLLHRTASVDVKNKKGNSPLWLACNGGHLDVVQLLVTASADIDSQDNRKVSCLMAAFRKGHIKVVKWMVKHVTQFPSDTELQRFISTMADKELQKKCQQSMDIIVSAKDRQAAEANKNANSLLQEIDRERALDEQKRQIAAKRRERRKERKKKGKMEKTKDGKDKNSSPEPESESGAQDQDADEDDDEENSDNSTPPPLPVTTVVTSTVSNMEAAVSRSSLINTTPCVPVSTSTSSAVSSTYNSPRTRAELRKNYRNRKERMESVMASKEAVISNMGGMKMGSVSTSLSNCGSRTSVPCNSTVTDPGLHTSNSTSHQTPTHSSSLSKRKKNELSKSTTSAKTGVGDLDDFNGSMSVGRSLSKDDHLHRKMEKLKLSNANNLISNDILNNISERESNFVPKLSSLGTSPRKGQRKDEGWKEVTRKSASQAAVNLCVYCRGKMMQVGTASFECCSCRSKKVVVPANVISRVIGRGGSNINSIRDASGAHVDIEKSQKGTVDRVITIKGSLDATRMASLMITALVQDSEKDISEIIRVAKGKPAEKHQQIPSSIGDFAIGTFSVPVSSSQSGGGVSSKVPNSSKSSFNRQSGSSNSMVNGRCNAVSMASTPINVWQNPAPGTPSPRRSPQKQHSKGFPSSVPSTSCPQYTQDKAVTSRQLGGEQRSSTSAAITTVNSTASETTPSVLKASSNSVGRVSSEVRQLQGVPNSTAGNGLSKAVGRPSPGGVRVLQRQPPGASRPEPQPLPIVAGHIPNSSNPVSNNVTSSNFSTFHLWNNNSPTPILSKKEDFASVAAAGVVPPNQPSQHNVQASSNTSTPTTNDPSKAVGYNPGLRTSSPQMRPDQAASEHPDMHSLGLRGSLTSGNGMLMHPGIPSPAGDGGHLNPMAPYMSPLDHHSIAASFLNHPMYQAMGHLPESKQEEMYSSPQEPMTLPVIKSKLNPNAMEFQIGSLGANPASFINGYPASLRDLRGDPVAGGQGDAGAGMPGERGAGNNMDAVHCIYAYLLQNMRTILQTPEQQMEYMEQLQSALLQQQQQQKQPQAPVGSPAAGGQAAGSGMLGHFSGLEGVPTPPSTTSIFPMQQPPLPRNVSPMPPGQHRPNSAPSLPDSAPTTPIRPGTLGSPGSIAPRTPPMPDVKQVPDERRAPGQVPRPIGMERAAQRKLPLGNSSPALGTTGEYNSQMWVISDVQKDWMSSTTPQMSEAALPTPVLTSSVVTGGNMAYAVKQRESLVQNPNTENLAGFCESFPGPSMESQADSSVQGWQRNWSNTDM